MISAAMDIGCLTILHLALGIRTETGFVEPVSILGGLNFNIETFSTLGYGDLLPAWPHRKHRQSTRIRD